MKTYTTKIVFLTTHPDLGQGRVDAIFEIGWDRTLTDTETGASVTACHRSWFEPEVIPVEGFTPFADVTEEQVKQWAEQRRPGQLEYIDNRLDFLLGQVNNWPGGKLKKDFPWEKKKPQP